MMTMDKSSSMGKRLLAMLLCFVQLTPVFAAAEPTADTVGTAGEYTKSMIMGTSGNTSETIRSVKYALYNSDTGTKIRVLNENAKTLSESVTVLGGENLQDLQEGHIKAGMDAYFENEDDAKNGIVKVVMDMVGRQTANPVDVMIVLDRSGSMNLYRTQYQNKNDESSGYANYNTMNGKTGKDSYRDPGTAYAAFHNAYVPNNCHPCLNKAHYYKIPVKKGKNGAVEYVKVYPTGDIVIDFPDGMDLTDLSDATYSFPMQDSASGSGWWDQTLKYIEAKVKEKGYSLSTANSTFSATFNSIATTHVLNTHYYWKDDEGEKEVTIQDAVQNYMNSQTNFVPMTRMDDGKEVSYSEPAGGSFFAPPFKKDTNIKAVETCVDRSVFSRVALSEFAQTILNAGTNNRVGLVAFDGEVTPADIVSLTNNIESLSQLWRDHGGGYGTNYNAALTAAESQLKSTQGEDGDANRQTYVIMVSDGAPSVKDENNQTDTSFEGIADRIDSRPNTAIFGIAIQTGANVYLEDYVASTTEDTDADQFNPAEGEYFKSCRTIDDFFDAVDVIENTILSSQGTITANIGRQSVDTTAPAGFRVLIDDEHPVSIELGAEDGNGTTNTYNTENDAEKAGYGIEIAANQIQWTYTPKENGARLVYYMQLDESLINIENNDLADDKEYPINCSAELVYTPYEGGVAASENKKVSLNVPANIHVQKAELTVTKHSDKEGMQVLPGEQIVYTFTGNATGSFAFENVTVADDAPANTELVKNGLLTKRIDSKMSDVPLGTMTVVVKDDAVGKIENSAEFNSATASDLTRNAETNTITNLLAGTVAAQFSAKKELTGRVLKAGEFEFELLEDLGSQTLEVVQTVSNELDGSVTFNELLYSKAGDVKTHRYIIREKMPAASQGLKNVVYDRAEYQVEVVVDREADGSLKTPVVTYTLENTPVKPENGEVVFVNQYIEAIDDLPKTGDASMLMRWIVLATASVSCLMLISRRRRFR